MKTLVYGLLFLVTVAQAAAQNTGTPSLTSSKDKAISGLSIYNLPSKWTDHNGRDMELKELQGKVIVMVMIYTSCKSACPRLVADMRNIEQRLAESAAGHVKFVLVSIDPQVDTPEHLKAFAIENKMDGEQWLFLRSTEDATREFAAVLAVNYKRISPIDFSHSNIISVFNTEGELAYQQEGLGSSYDEIVTEINKQVKKM